MKFIKSKWIILIAIMSHGGAAMADSFPARHTCFKPRMPTESISQSEVDRLNDHIDRYRQCILDFVDEQNRGISNHEKSAQSAIDEWNHFVKKNGLDSK